MMYVFDVDGTLHQAVKKLTIFLNGGFKKIFRTTVL